MQMEVPRTLLQSTFQVDTSGSSFNRSDNVYPLTNGRRGLVAVFNNHFKNKLDQKRDGSEMDDVNLESVFSQMGYEIKLYPDCNKEDTMQNIENLISNDLRNKDSFILFILSHGKDESHFYAADDELIDVKNIWLKLSDQNCSVMKGKPKILFQNFCRGSSRQANLFADGKGENSEYAPSDLAVINAALAGFKAMRSEKGTIFVHCLCTVLCKYARDRDLHDIVNLTSEKMQEMNATTPSIAFVDFKRKFYFLD